MCSYFQFSLCVDFTSGSDGIGPPATIYVSSMIATAGAISGDNMQDLKTGHMLQATPWKQQVIQFLSTFPIS